MVRLLRFLKESLIVKIAKKHLIMNGNQYVRWFCVFSFVILFSCAEQEQKNQKPFPLIDITDHAWAFYEGRWNSEDGVVLVELALESGAFGIDAEYKIHQAYYEDNSATGTGIQKLYATYTDPKSNELKICLQDVGEWKKGFLRYEAIRGDKKSFEMYFRTRGNEELIPCDNNYNALTTDWRYTLHRRSDLMTVEGYLTFDHDTAEYYERNVMKYWKVAELGEFEELKSKYKEVAEEKFQGIYLKALAYSIVDTVMFEEKKALVIKRILDFNEDPDIDK